MIRSLRSWASVVAAASLRTISMPASSASITSRCAGRRMPIMPAAILRAFHSSTSSCSPCSRGCTPLYAPHATRTWPLSGSSGCARITVPTRSSSRCPPPVFGLSSGGEASPSPCSSPSSVSFPTPRPLPPCLLRAPVRCHTSSHRSSRRASHAGPRQSLRTARPCCLLAIWRLMCHPVASFIAVCARSSQISHACLAPIVPCTSCTMGRYRIPS